MASGKTPSILSLRLRTNRALTTVMNDRLVFRRGLKLPVVQKFFRFRITPHRHCPLAMAMPSCIRYVAVSYWLLSSGALAQHIPAGFKVERYIPLWEHNPFTIAAPPATPPLRQPAPGGSRSSSSVLERITGPHTLHTVWLAVWGAIQTVSRPDQNL